MTGGTYFTGGNGVGIAFEQCGIRDVFGVEYDDRIAQVARDNGFPVITADVRAVDPATLPYVDWFSSSPVCVNASVAKADGEESPEDMETAQAVERYIDYHKPRIVSLENVWGYRKFKAFAGILKCLERNGYLTEYWHLNSADYGVPQTRKRLILVARRDGIKPRKPLATHAEKPAPLFDDRKKWIGWYAAIEDLIPTLPPSKFAQWQLARLPETLQSVMIGGGNRSESFLEFAKEHRPDTPGKRFPNEPSHAVSATASSDMRALLVDSAMFADTGLNAAAQDEPANSIVANYARRDLKAFLMPNENSSSAVIRDAVEPSGTVGATQRVGNVARAFLMQVQGEGGDGIKAEDEPMQAVTESHGAGKYRAFAMDGLHGGTREQDEPFNAVVADGGSGTVGVKAFISAGGDAWSPVLDDTAPLFTQHATRAFLVNESSTMEVRPAPAPAPTQVANGRNGGQGQRAYLEHGRVVKMTPRALARFQSFPDSYVLPDNARLACTIIGNAVPPLLMQAVIEAQGIARSIQDAN